MHHFQPVHRFFSGNLEAELQPRLAGEGGQPQKQQGPLCARYLCGSCPSAGT